MSMVCADLVEVTSIPEPAAQECAQCIASGDTWVHLRMCLECENVACCDDSKNRHATAHFNTTNHPVIRSTEPGERWLWCYRHEQAVPW